MARKSKRTGSFPIGSLSSGSLLDTDLASAAEDAIRLLIDFGYASEKTAAQHLAELNQVDEDDSNGENGDIITDADNFINDRCPPYVYYGGHGGDPADIGFWISWESLEEDRRTGELPSDDDLPRRYTGLAVNVSDHGNVELYEYKNGKSVRSVWGVV